MQFIHLSGRNHAGRGNLPVMSKYDWIHLIGAMIGFALGALLLSHMSAKRGFDTYLFGRYVHNAGNMPLLFCIIPAVALGQLARWVAQWLGV